MGYELSSHPASHHLRATYLAGTAFPALVTLHHTCAPDHANSSTQSRSQHYIKSETTVLLGRKQRWKDRLQGLVETGRQ